MRLVQVGRMRYHVYDEEGRLWLVCSSRKVAEYYVEKSLNDHQ